MFHAGLLKWFSFLKPKTSKVFSFLGFKEKPDFTLINTAEN